MSSPPADPSPRPGRAAPDARLVGAGLLVLLLVPLFLPRLRPPHGRVWEAGWDALHFPGFILITWTFALLLRPWARSATSQIAAGACLATQVAILSELSHDALGRSSSWKDFGVDILGITCGVIGWQLLRRGGAAGRVVFGLLVAGLLGVLIMPAVLGHRAVREIRARFPDLGAFSHPGSSRVWRPQGNAILHFETQPAPGSLRVHVGPGLYSGVTCLPAQGDWTRHQALHLDIRNPGDPFDLGIRIDDDRSASSDHDSRYNGQQHIPPGRVALRLPLAEIQTGPSGRPLDLGRIHRLALFTGAETGDREFVIDAAYLD